MFNSPFLNYNRPYYVPTYEAAEPVKPIIKKEESKKTFNFSQIFDSIKDFINSDKVVFNVLGFDLYFDDILILLILFFLYTEESKDYYLYIALILLLLN